MPLKPYIKALVLNTSKCWYRITIQCYSSFRNVNIENNKPPNLIKPKRFSSHKSISTYIPRIVHCYIKDHITSEFYIFLVFYLTNMGYIYNSLWQCLMLIVHFRWQQIKNLSLYFSRTVSPQKTTLVTLTLCFAE